MGWFENDSTLQEYLSFAVLIGSALFTVWLLSTNLTLNALYKEWSAEGKSWRNVYGIFAETQRILKDRLKELRKTP